MTSALIKLTTLLARRCARLGALIRAVALIAISTLTISTPAAAHPHIWVTYRLVSQMSGKKLVALREKWIFGPEFPLASLLPAGDIPVTGSFSARATERLRAQAFASLASDGYFTHVFIDGKPVQMDAPQQFTAAIEKGRLTYSFAIRMAAPVPADQGQLVVGIWDDSFFVDATPVSADGGHGAVQFSPDARSCQASSYRDNRHAIYGGMVFPIAIRISC